MRILTATAFICVLPAALAPADDLTKLQKIYFASTKPGAWAKYEQASTDKKGKVTVTEMTMSRLENEDGKIWLEIHIEPKTDKKNKATTLKYRLTPDFPIEKNALDFLKYIDKVIVQADGKAQEMPWQQMRMMVGGSLGYMDYGGSVTLKGTETVEGKTCDRYGIKGPFEVKVLFVSIKGTTDGDLWLNESVPFARVKESIVTNDDKGQLMTRSEMKLLDSAMSGAKTRVTGPVEKAPEMPDLSKAFGGN